MLLALPVQIRPATMEGWIAGAKVVKAVGAVAVLWIRMSVAGMGSGPAMVTMTFVAVLELRKGAMVLASTVVALKGVRMIWKVNENGVAATALLDVDAVAVTALPRRSNCPSRKLCTISLHLGGRRLARICVRHLAAWSRPRLC